VLVSGEFSEVPPLVHEGRQILRNIQRVARLFAVKAIMTAFLLVVIALPTGIFPLLPRQFTLASSVALGIPAFFLALAPSHGPWRPEGFLKAIARFSFPAGVASGLGVLTAYLVARYGFDLTLAQSRTATVATVVAAGLAVVVVLEDEPGRRRLAVAGLVSVMALAFVVVAALPAGRDFFDLDTPTGAMVGAWAIGMVVLLVCLWAALRVVDVLDRRAGVEE
jgi:magnesium-transporting ATPase (P-type)